MNLAVTARGMPALDRVDLLPREEARELLSQWEGIRLREGTLDAVRAVCLLSRRLEPAESTSARLEEALRAHPDDAWLLSLAAEVRIELGDPEAALTLARRALRLMPELPMPWLAMADALAGSYRWKDAIQAACSGCEVAPRDVAPGARLAAIAKNAGFGAEELDRFASGRHVTLTAGWTYAQALLWRDRDLTRAIAEIETCLAVATPTPVLLGTAANLHKQRGASARALELVEQAIALGDPDQENERIYLLWDLGRHRDAWNALQARKASKDAPIETLRLYEALIATNVGRHDESRRILATLDDKHYKHPDVGAMLLGVEAYCFDDPATMLRHARILSGDAGQAASLVPWFDRISVRESSGRLRVGLLSNNFSAHPVSMLTLAAFEGLDQDRFEIVCFETNETKRDVHHARWRAVAAEWHGLSGKNGFDAALAVAKADVDILIDLQGYSKRAIVSIPFARPAPVQVKWIGMQAFSTGMSTMDHFLSDTVETPEGFDAYYSERLIRLPRSYVAFEMPDTTGFPETPPCVSHGFVTFGYFNNLQKMSPEAFEAWCRILHAVPDAKMLLKAPQLTDGDTASEIAERFRNAGIPIERLMFRGRTSRDEQLRAIASVDIALDPFPYSGGVCTLEALSVGVPVVALAGRSFAARHSASHLTWSGAPELVAGSFSDYVDLAIELAKAPERLVEYRKSLPMGLRRPGGPADIEGAVAALTAELERLGEEARTKRASRGTVALGAVPDVVHPEAREAVERAFSLAEGEFSEEWAMPRDTLATILTRLARQGAVTVMECGSGVSTLALLLFAERLGLTRVVSFEHDLDWAMKVRGWADRVGKGELLDLRHRNLVETSWGGLEGGFYALADEDLQETHDALIVDGPPSNNTGGAFPRAMAGVLIERALRSDGRVFLEDARRRPETIAYRSWMDAQLLAEAELVNVGRGLFVARRR